MTAGAATGGAAVASVLSTIPTTLVAGRGAAEREAAIAAALARGALPAAVILEGLADATAPLAPAREGVQVTRIAPGCLCCTGNLVLRVTLNRVLRQGPARLFISLANAEHVGQLQEMLSTPPYVSLLTLLPILHIGHT